MQVSTHLQPLVLRLSRRRVTATVQKATGHWPLIKMLFVDRRETSELKDCEESQSGESGRGLLGPESPRPACLSWTQGA